MLEHVSDAIAHLRDYFPERALSLRAALIAENARHSRLEEWQESLLAHFIEILVGSSGDLYRAHQEKRISTLAWQARNLLELSVWVEFCTGSDERAKQFHEDALRDMFGWSQAIHGMFKRKHDREHQELSVKIDELRKFAATRGIPELADDFIRVRDVATALGRKDFGALYKLYSKFAHPTAWAVHSVSSVDADEDFRDMFLADGINEAVVSINRVRDRILFFFPELR